MLSKLFGFLRGKGVIVKGVDKLPEGQAKVIDIGDPLAGGKQVVLCRVGGKLYAVDRLCPHEGGRLIEGPLAEKQYVVCPLHNYRFDPKSGAAVGVACKSATTYKVEMNGNDCEIFV
ncbi:MAG: Rieske (2Fe-2S) protein [Planctomycetes bacterium]|nr:Rieske (2Fe-2S) protein [Planctomycetota bacterium]